MSLPQPRAFAATGGAWRPGTVRVVAQDPTMAGEAERLRGELRTLGLPPDDGGPDGAASVVRLCRGEVPLARQPVAPGYPDEAYLVDVADDVRVTASTAVGAFRGTRQLLHNLRAQGAVPRGRALGASRVVERGLHLDTGRKHYPAEWIIALVHAAADVGINVFQWHFSDNEGFRVPSDAFPEISSAEHLTRAEVRDVVEAARDQHIHLIPALDMPGHLRQVLATRPGLRLGGADPAGAEVAAADALDITSPEGIRFAHLLIDDLAPLFPHSTRWHLGGDEFVDFTRIGEYPALAAAARDRFGEEANGFDLLTEFVNVTAAHLETLDLEARAWNDGMLRGAVVPLDPAVVLTWWTNWNAQMRTVADAVAAGHGIVNVNDELLYHVLGERAGYRYPTARRFWEKDWHPGLFPTLTSGRRQELTVPYPALLRGCAFAVWADEPDAQSPGEVAAAIRAPLRAMAERAWNSGTALSLTEFAELDGLITWMPTRPDLV